MVTLMHLYLWNSFEKVQMHPKNLLFNKTKFPAEERL